MDELENAKWKRNSVKAIIYSVGIEFSPVSSASDGTKSCQAIYPSRKEITRQNGDPYQTWLADQGGDMGCKVASARRLPR